MLLGPSNMTTVWPPLSPTPQTAAPEGQASMLTCVILGCQGAESQLQHRENTAEARVLEKPGTGQNLMQTSGGPKEPTEPMGDTKWSGQGVGGWPFSLVLRDPLASGEQLRRKD